MRVCVDTNILIRLAIPVVDGSEDGKQAQIAGRLIRNASAVIVTLPVLCEFCWVLRSVYRYSAHEIATAVVRLLGVQIIETDRRSASAGLDVLAAGGDFADGVIAEAGFLAGADRFVSFDQRAVRLVGATGRDAAMPV